MHFVEFTAVEENEESKPVHINPMKISIVWHHTEESTGLLIGGMAFYVAGNVNNTLARIRGAYQ